MESIRLGLRLEDGLWRKFRARCILEGVSYMRLLGHIVTRLVEDEQFWHDVVTDFRDFGFGKKENGGDVSK